MSGILLLSLGIAWLLLSAFIALNVTKAIPTLTRVIATPLIVAVLLLVPFVDEYLGKKEFAALCLEHAPIKFDAATAKGKQVYLEDAADVPLSGHWVPVTLKPWRFNDVETGEVVVSYDSLLASGGWVVRSLGTSEGRVPLTFSGSCESTRPVDIDQLLVQLQLVQVQRSTVESKRKQ